MSTAKIRSSNIELYRIIVMLAIVAQHYVVNSGISGTILPYDQFSMTSAFYWIFGLWGKTGINCFMLITGYYMCTSYISLRKFLRLYLEIVFYRIVIWLIFIACGRDVFTTGQAVKNILPFTNISVAFSQAYLAFFLLIPFVNILVRNMRQREHVILIGLCLMIYTLMYSVRPFVVTYNYVSWFVVIYLIAAYIRLYGLPKNENTAFWFGMTIVTFILGALSVIYGIIKRGNPGWMLRECLSIVPVLVSVSSFMFFKNIHIPTSKVINIVASTAFGVLLIHAHSWPMRNWLWNEVIDVAGHYGAGHFVLYSIISVIAVYGVCCIIDLFRIYALERPLFMLLDKYLCRIPIYQKVS